MKDLEDMSACAPLQPYIQTLTFGGARFDSIGPLGPDLDIAWVLNHVSVLHQSRLWNAYNDAYLWQLSEGEEYNESRLENILAKLPNLKTIRILAADSPDDRTHLGGWLSEGTRIGFSSRPSAMMTASTKRGVKIWFGLIQ
jgi:hypothetical protein